MLPPQRIGEPLRICLIQVSLQSTELSQVHDALAEVIAADGRIAMVGRRRDDVFLRECVERGTNERPAHSIKVSRLCHPRIMRDVSCGTGAGPLTWKA